VLNSKIKSIEAKEILDSRKIPTIETKILTDFGVFYASVPSGTSRGKFEAVEIRNKDGKGVKKAIEKAESEFEINGNYCWLSLGSEGRKEQLIRTDQDNALVYISEKNEEKKAYIDFSARVTKLLEFCGFEACPAEIMASNPLYCLNLDEWKKLFSKWIQNPDPENLIQRVLIHGDKINVIDNIPIDEARKIFEEEIDGTKKVEIIKIKEKVKKNPEYEPTEDDLEVIKDLVKNPEIYLDEGQLQKIYEYPQGTLWDFFLHAFGIKEIPNVKKRVEQGFNNYINTYNFTDEQIKALRRIKDIFVANKLEKKEFSVDEIFANPIFERLLGSKSEVEKLFDGKFTKIMEDLEGAIKA